MIPKSLYILFCSSHNPFFWQIEQKKSPVDPYYPSILKYSNVQALLMSFYISTVLTQDVMKLTCMVETVTFFVPPTVKTTLVTFNREPVLGVSLGGRGYTAT